MTTRSELHFFPGAHLMVWLVDGHPAIRAEAWGGEEPEVGVLYDTMKPQPTTPGRYVIYSYKPYVTRTWAFSRIAWGTRLRLEGDEVFYETGRKIRPLAPLTDKIPDATRSNLKTWYANIYGTARRFDTDGDGIPEWWVFNDFGPRSVRYFRDKNHNGRLDKGESLSGEMIHTTPINEAEVAAGAAARLFPSHGCIHVSPTARDQLHAAGAFKRGNGLVIHRYDEVVPASFR